MSEDITPGDEQIPPADSGDLTAPASQPEPPQPEPTSPPAETTPAAEAAPTDAAAASAPRKRGKALVTVMSLLLVALIGVGGWYAWQQIDTRNRALAVVDDATLLIENADVVVLEVDEIVRAEITPEIGARATDVQADIQGAIDDLDEAAGMIEGALPELREDDIPRAEALMEAARARSEMLNVSTAILEGNAKAAVALSAVLDGWAAVLEGEKLLDEAVVEYNKLTDAAVKKSRDITVQAERKLQSAEDLFSQATTAFPEADLGVYYNYINGKQQLVTLSKQADDAFLKGDKAKANTLSDEYNVKDKKLVESGKALPDTPAALIATAYEAVAGEATTRYFEARDRATIADKALKDLED